VKGTHPVLESPTKSRRIVRIHISKAVEIFNNEFVNRNTLQRCNVRREK
jgi:hypothetical protein